MTDLQQTGAPEPVRELADSLSRIHGLATITKEEGGWHIRIASPKALDEHGAVELRKRHLYVNAEKYARIGRYRRLTTGDPEADLVGFCMKTKTPYSVSELLAMKPLASRGFKKTVTKVIDQPEAFLVQDEHGVMVPDRPGKTIPLGFLPPDHPAVVYVRSRNFDPRLLWEWCHASYCTEAAPEGREWGRFYRRMVGGIQDTPEGRLILECRVRDSRIGWQARILDKDEGDARFHWISEGGQPLRWVHTHSRADGKLHLLSAFDHENYPFSPSKYRNAAGSKRNAQLMGLDASVARAKSMGINWCCLAEGPLDAARLYQAGLPAVAVLGKFLSETQATMLAREFSRVVVVPDNDQVGKDALPDMLMKLTDANVRALSCPIPESFGVKDAGDLTPEQAKDFAQIIKNQLQLK